MYYLYYNSTKFTKYSVLGIMTMMMIYLIFSNCLLQIIHIHKQFSRRTFANVMSMIFIVKKKSVSVSM